MPPGSRDLLEVASQKLYRLAHFDSAHCGAVAGDDEFGFERGKPLDRIPGGIPVRSIVLRRPMYLGFLQEHGVGRFLPRCNDSVTRDERAIRFTPKRDVAGRVARRGDATPARHEGHLVVCGEQREPARHVDRLAWKEPRSAGHESAPDVGTRRRVGAAAAEEWVLEAVGVYRRFPLGGKLGERADMVEVTVGQNDRRRRGMFAKALRGGLEYGFGRAGDAGVDQDPTAFARTSVEDDVGEHRFFVGEIRGDFIAATEVGQIDRHAGGLKGNLFGHALETEGALAAFLPDTPELVSEDFPCRPPLRFASPPRGSEPQANRLGSGEG